MRVRRALLLIYTLFAIMYQFNFRPTLADISFSEISGEYTLETGNLPLCRDVVEIRARGNLLTAENVIFGGVPCVNGEFVLQQDKGLQGWTDFGKRDAGIVIFANGTYNLECWSTNMSKTLILFMRPNAIVRLTFRGFNSFAFLKDIRYFYVAGNDGGCVYRRKLSVATPSPMPTSSDKKIREKNDLNLWVWLGPVLGAAATIAAAIITVFKCTRRDSKQRQAPANGTEDDK